MLEPWVIDEFLRREDLRLAARKVFDSEAIIGGRAGAPATFERPLRNRDFSRESGSLLAETGRLRRGCKPWKLLGCQHGLLNLEGRMANRKGQRPPERTQVIDGPETNPGRVRRRVGNREPFAVPRTPAVEPGN